ncbi:RNA polymerase III RPC4 [Teratosphaeria destructans]|uniref:RNA polymerase III RPC4 n=1 Tax=Teratosphaeria destructans TaxID=418781 RepID=A0A9W7W2X8_9PEZI|nr:RNA polymerase III RPC4 [Teratosphaeria destructans]
MPPKKPIRRAQPPKPGQAAAGASDSQNEPDVKPDPESIATGSTPAIAGNEGQTPFSIGSTPVAPSPAPSNGTPAPQRPPALSRTSSTRGGRGTPKIAAPKFAGRRSQAQRAEAEKAEAERQRLEAERKAKEDVRKARQQGRGRGRGDGAQHRGRGRGGYIGQSERQPPVASGPFSAGQVNSDMGGRRFGGGRGGGGGGEGTFFGGPMTGFNSGGRSGGGGGGSVKREPGGGDFTMVSQGIKTEDGGYISSDAEEENDQRIDVDELRIVDLTADDAPPEQGSMLPPVRVKREAHKERTIGITADTATVQDGKEADQPVSDRRKGKQRARDVEITGQSDSFQAAYSSDEQEPSIKAEPMDDDGVGDAEPLADNEAAPQPPSPELKRKKERTKSRTLSGTALQRPVYQTQDELDEWERHQNDLRLLHSELGSLVLPSSTDQDGDANMETADQQPADNKADKVYLFQFPPVLPDLLPIQVKPDPDAPAPAADGDVMQVDGQPNTAADPVKVEDGPAQTKLPSGAVGKMKVHRSGKVTLDWGGTSLLVGMGVEAGFLQDVLVAALPDQKGATDEDQLPGVAMSMGQVKGKFVVTPDWEKILAY